MMVHVDALPTGEVLLSFSEGDGITQVTLPPDSAATIGHLLIDRAHKAKTYDGTAAEAEAEAP